MNATSKSSNPNNYLPNNNAKVDTTPVRTVSVASVSRLPEDHRNQEIREEFFRIFKEQKIANNQVEEIENKIKNLRDEIQNREQLISKPVLMFKKKFLAKNATQIEEIHS